MTTPTATLARGGLLKTIAVGVVARIHERRDGAMTTTGIAAKPGGQGAKTAARFSSGVVQAALSPGLPQGSPGISFSGGR